MEIRVGKGRDSSLKGQFLTARVSRTLRRITKRCTCIYMPLRFSVESSFKTDRVQL